MASTRNNVRYIQWLIWICLLLALFFYSVELFPFFDALNYAVTTTASYAFIIYVSALWLIPRFYRRKKYVLFVLLLLLLLAGVTVFRENWQSYVMYQLIQHTPHEVKLVDYTYMLITHCLIFVDSIILRFTLDYFLIRDQQARLVKESAESRYHLLKTQVHPHFLFNTLNNIYYVAQRESPQTAELLQKLSGIMRYFTDKAEKSSVSLAEELAFINQYVDMENLRLRYPVHVRSRISGDPAGISVPPMLLIPLVENVFKHGISHDSAANGLQLIVSCGRRLEVVVQNTLAAVTTGDTRAGGRTGSPAGSAVPGGGPQTGGPASGTGLRNLRERLAILYPGDFTLQASVEGACYVSRLNIPL